MNPYDINKDESMLIPIKLDDIELKILYLGS